MKPIDFSRITDWKTFERLTADLLEVEGFRILREPAVDRSGMDILAEETILSHSGFSHTVRWFVQCKHYAGSGRNLARKELEQILYGFDVRSEEGLLIVIDSDITAEGYRVMEQYARRSTAKRLIKVWNQRELENRLLRHPTLAKKYGVSTGTLLASLTPFDGIELQETKILIVSDTSPFAYQLFTSINRFNPNVQMITVWQYGESQRVEHLLGGILSTSHDLVIFFLGDTFRFRVPPQLVEKLVRTAQAGNSVMLFPFFAWALFQGAYQSLHGLLPVKLAEEPSIEQFWLKASRIFSTGDISWRNPEAFIENQYAVVKADEQHPVLKGIEGDFGVIHSFEFLTLKEGARCLLSDNLGTPFLVVNEMWDAPVVSLTSCMHNCLTTAPMLSSFELSESYQRVIVNTVLWCLGLDVK
jgi:hypothetical protein